MEFVVFVEGALVSIITISSLPVEGSLLAHTIDILPFKPIPLSRLHTMSMECIFAEASNILHSC